MTTEAKVGIFVLTSLLILTSTILYLANAQFRGGKVAYRTYLHYAGGLEAGAPVLFGGIKAGSVTGVRPWKSDPTRIEILVELKEGTPVNQKSIAKLGSVSVMSEPALLVSTGTNDAARIAPGQPIPSQEAVTLDEIAAKMATVAGNANDLIVQVQGELGGISSDARTLLAKSDCTHRQFQLLSAVTAQRTQYVTREALRMNTQQRRIPGHLAQNKGDRSLDSSNAVVSLPLEPDSLKHSPPGG